VPSLGLMDAPTWFAVRLTAPEAMERWLSISYSVLDDVRVYLYEDGQQQLAVLTGDRLPFAERPVFNRNFIIPMAFQSEREYLLLIRVQTGGALHLPATLWEQQAFAEAEQDVLSLQMIFLGMMLALAVYNLLLFFVVWDRAYLWYVLMLVSASFVQMGVQGFTYQYLWPESPRLNEVILPAMIAVAFVSLSLFTHSFLNLAKHSLVASRVIRGAAILGGLLFFFSLVAPYSMSIRILILMSFVLALVLLVVGIYIWSRGEILARFFVVAFATFLVGNAIYTLNKAGILPHNLWTEHAIQIGHSIEVLLLSFALAYRITLERRRRLSAQREANEQLESRVRERTTELAAAYQEVKRLSQTDGLTQVSNRICFEDSLAEEWRRCGRQGDSLALIMLDADNFKHINDTWGHQCGDAALQLLATMCKEELNRAGDMVARFGGEEFVVLLPVTNVAGAVKVAERLRRKIADYPFQWQQEPVPLTVSLGVASCVPVPEVSHEILVQQADRALYAAKAGGRNQVMQFDPATETVISSAG